MTAADKKTTYTAAKVAKLIHPLTQSVEALQKENAELKRKLEHMPRIAGMPQRLTDIHRSDEQHINIFPVTQLCGTVGCFLVLNMHHIDQSIVRHLHIMELLLRAITGRALSKG